MVCVFFNVALLLPSCPFLFLMGVFWCLFVHAELFVDPVLCVLLLGLLCVLWFRVLSLCSMGVDPLVFAIRDRSMAF